MRTQPRTAFSVQWAKLLASCAENAGELKVGDFRPTVQSSDRQVKVKVKVGYLIYSASYVSQTRDQKRFAISEVAADWHQRHELM